MDALREELLPRAALLTPNVPEASDLTGLRVENEDEMRAAGEKLLGLGARAVLMKGGHLDGEKVVDLFLEEAESSALAVTESTPGPPTGPAAPCRPPWRRTSLSAGPCRRR